MSLTSRLNQIEKQLAATRTTVPWDDLAEAYTGGVDGEMSTKAKKPLDIWEDWQGQRWGDAKTVIRMPPRVTAMRLAKVQQALWQSKARINVVPAGRRSGKTEMAKRHGVKKATRYPRGTRGRVVFCAPVHNQAKRIYWDDLKLMIPANFLAGKPSESELTIRLKNGVDIVVMGMDEPARIEGPPLLGIVCDEYANMRPEVWDAHIRPALVDTQGWAWLIGVPEGRNHYYELYNQARTDETGEMATFTWATEDVLPLYLGDEVAHRELSSAKAKMDPMTYDQEFNASFLNFVGSAYYQFSFDEHCGHNLLYNPKSELKFCFDFNESPGVAVVCQDHVKRLTTAIGEVYIPRGSNTPMVCRKLIEDWGKHEGIVTCYGDATGGAGGSAKVDGSDIELLERALKRHFGRRLRMRFPNSNPRERARVNAMNSWLRDADDKVHIEIDAAKCPYLIKDFEGTRVVKGGSGELDKKTDLTATHPTDAFGYKVVFDNPVTEVISSFRQVA